MKESSTFKIKIEKNCNKKRLSCEKETIHNHINN